MAWETYDDTCDGCKPVLLDLTTGKLLPDDNPAVRAMARIWDQMSLAERQAFHRVTCLNSRAQADLLVIQSIQRQMQKAAVQ